MESIGADSSLTKDFSVLPESGECITHLLESNLCVHFTTSKITKFEECPDCEDYISWKEAINRRDVNLESNFRHYMWSGIYIDHLHQSL